MASKIQLSSWHTRPPVVVMDVGPKPGGCPICSSTDHAVCRFETGSLYCYTHNCANPHHRSKV